MTATKPASARIVVLLAGAMLSAVVCYFATVMLLLIAGDQRSVDPITHQWIVEPWWAMFNNSDWRALLVLPPTSLVSGWLTWFLCRQAFPRRRCKSSHAL